MSIASPVSHQFLTEADQAALRSTVAGITQSDQFHLEVNGSIYALPPYAAQKIVSVLDSLAEGQGVTIIPIPDQAELTVAQAAQILNTSEAGVHELFDLELFKYRLEGDQYRIDRGSLLEFEALRRKRHEGLNKIARMSQEMGIYDIGHDDDE